MGRNLTKSIENGASKLIKDDITKLTSDWVGQIFLSVRANLSIPIPFDIIEMDVISESIYTQMQPILRLKRTTDEND